MRLMITKYKTYLLVVISMCFMVTDTEAKQTELGPIQLASENPDLVLDSVRLDKFSSNGALTYVLEALSLKQNSFSGTSHIDRPVIVFENPEGILWRVVARRGKLYKPINGVVLADEVIQLSGDVQIIQSSSSNQKLKIDSEHFFLFPSNNYAETMSPVSITTPTMTTTAANLSINLQSGEIKLESSPMQNIETQVLYAQTK